MDAEEYVTIDLDHVLARAYQMRRHAIQVGLWFGGSGS